MTATTDSSGSERKGAALKAAQAISFDARERLRGDLHETTVRQAVQAGGSQ